MVVEGSTLSYRALTSETPTLTLTLALVLTLALTLTLTLGLGSTLSYRALTSETPELGLGLGLGLANLNPNPNPNPNPRDYQLVLVRQGAQLLIEVSEGGAAASGAERDVPRVAQDVARWDRHRVEL